MLTAEARLTEITTNLSGPWVNNVLAGDRLRVIRRTVIPDEDGGFEVTLTMRHEDELVEARRTRVTRTAREYLRALMDMVSLFSFAAVVGGLIGTVIFFAKTVAGLAP